MAGEAELGAVMTIIRNRLLGKTITAINYSAPDQAVIFEVDGAVAIRMPTSDVITTMLEMT